ncbi:MAG: IS66 family insertion sequence element accessory protein TnpB [Acetobacteraceae bacterium]|nr:IS66 family insertion sequence element accessory protein TnpB [Acetobacteraceae bacterium]MBV8588546.1 IS66 family insertion sequence element accessory protein TnpB [Acetobacteraceae bacterium]
MILGIPSRPGLRIVVASKPIDFRKGMDSLAALVMQALAADPFTGDIFIFRSKRMDRLKLLVWDGSGLCLVTKRLQTGVFTWPPVRDGAVTLSAAQLRLLFTGMDWTQLGAGTMLAPAG